MANKQGDWIWYELMTPDAEESSRFYTDVMGWTVVKHLHDPTGYREITATAGMVGGMLPLTEDMVAAGARPAWLGYIAVDNVDATTHDIVLAGGHVFVPPRDIPGVGRFALLADPQGAPFYIIHYALGGRSSAFVGDRPLHGHCAWNELLTSDPAAAKSFYFGQFGWEKDGEIDMGPLGAYEMIRNGKTIGALMKNQLDVPTSSWNYYFRVPDIDAAATATEALGGQVVHGPVELPGGAFSLNATDPQGAVFALIGERKG